MLGVLSCDRSPGLPGTQTPTPGGVCPRRPWLVGGQRGCLGPGGIRNQEMRSLRPPSSPTPPVVSVLRMGAQTISPPPWRGQPGSRLHCPVWEPLVPCGYFKSSRLKWQTHLHILWARSAVQGLPVPPQCPTGLVLPRWPLEERFRHHRDAAGKGWSPPWPLSVVRGWGRQHLPRADG